jgi:hypothetical protein
VGFKNIGNSSHGIVVFGVTGKLRQSGELEGQ